MAEDESSSGPGKASRRELGEEPTRRELGEEPTRRELGEEPTRRELGEEMVRQVYGELPLLPEGHVYGDALVEQLFAEVWSRPALDIPRRRLLVMGALAAQGRFEQLGFQFQRVLAAGELTPAQLDEVVLQLTHYVGWGMSQPIVTEAEKAKAAHARTAPTEREQS